MFDYSCSYDNVKRVFSNSYSRIHFIYVLNLFVSLLMLLYSFSYHTIVNFDQVGLENF